MSLSQLFTEIEQTEWVDIPSGWLQGRTIYGGLVAGILMHKALITIADSAKYLLSTSITFVHEVGIASNRGSECRGEYVPGAKQQHQAC